MFSPRSRFLSLAGAGPFLGRHISRDNTEDLLTVSNRDTKLRVLFVCGVNGHGGPIRSVCTVLGALPDVDKIVASQRGPEGSPPTDLERLADEFITMPRPQGPRGLLAAQAVLLRKSRWIARHVDVVHANGLTEAMVIVPLAFVTRIPVVVWVHNWEIPRPVWRARAPLRWLTRGWRWCAVSSLSRDLVASTGVVRSDRITMLPNPIDPAVVPPRRKPSEQVRVCFLAGTDRRSKGFDLIGPTAAALTGTEAKWIIFTSPPYTTNEDGWAALFALPSGTFEVRERVGDIAEAFAECDVVFAPSRSESFNRVIAEAMTNGLAVVASDLPVHRELLGDQEAGLLFELDNPAAATAAIRQAVGDPALRARLGSRGQVLASRFSPEEIVQVLRGAYREAISSRVTIKKRTPQR